jgi:MFS family permease
MELEEMQAVWSQMSDQLENQKRLTNKLIMEMTEQKFKNRFSTVSSYETIGAVICLGAVVFIVLNIDKINTWYLWICAIVSLVFLIILPVLNIRSIHSIKNINLQKNSYKETFIEYTKKKRNLLLVQKLATVCSIVVMWTTAPVFGTILTGEDFFKQNYSLSMLLFFGVVTAAVLIFALWGYNNYKRITASAEKVIKELKVPNFESI